MDDHSPPEKHHGGSNGTSSSPPSQKRQRAKQACEPCRLRKRRCDGSMPCNMCTQFEYKCYFEKHPRKRSKLVEQHAHADLAAATATSGSGDGSPTAAAAVGLGATSAKILSPVEASRHPVEEISKMRSMEANSGIAFTRLLGMRLDPSSGPKLFTFGWNLGINYAPVLPGGPPITDFVSQDQLFMLAKVYFDHVHPIFGFLDKDWILQGIAHRWSEEQNCGVPDHILCGIAALGILFSTTPLKSVLTGLVESQRQSLERSGDLRPPGLKEVQSWVLRCLYLRAADHPHAVWMATSRTMHLIEAVGLQQEVSSTVLHPAVSDSYDDPEIRRRVFWIARMLNSWVSFEYGRTRVALRGITAGLPKSKDGDYTTDYINLYSISCCLDPEQSDQAPQWEEFLAQLDAYDAPHPAIMLSKANLALCGYRRLRIANPNLSPHTINKIIHMGLKGLEAARELAALRLGWWHVSNVPFQVICVFLAMDVREALSHLGAAMRTLEFVVAQFGTMAIKEVLKTARFLIRLSKKRKDEDSQALAATLERDGAGTAVPENVGNHSTVTASTSNHSTNHTTSASLPIEAESNRALQTPFNSAVPVGSLHDTPLTAASSEDWSLDILNNSNFDWNFCKFCTSSAI